MVTESFKQAKNQILQQNDKYIGCVCVCVCVCGWVRSEMKWPLVIISILMVRYP